MSEPTPADVAQARALAKRAVGFTWADDCWGCQAVTAEIAQALANARAEGAHAQTRTAFEQLRAHLLALTPEAE